MTREKLVRLRGEGSVGKDNKRVSHLEIDKVWIA